MAMLCSTHFRILPAVSLVTEYCNRFRDWLCYTPQVFSHLVSYCQVWSLISEQIIQNILQTDWFPGSFLSENLTFLEYKSVRYLTIDTTWLFVQHRMIGKFVNAELRKIHINVVNHFKIFPGICWKK